MKSQGRTGRNPTTNRRKPNVTTTLLQRRARALQQHLPAAVRGDDHGVHQARVATRRLREAVPVLTSGVKGTRAGKASRKIKRLTRALGTVRELDVTIQILDELARRPDIPRSAVEEVRAHVMAERDGRRKVMLERLDEVDPDRLARRLQSVAAALASAEGEPWREALAARLVKRARRFTAAVHEAGRVYAPEPLHLVRISTKKLRYALELAADVGVATALPMVRLLKRNQEILGRLNDLNVLKRHVAEVQATAPARRPDMTASLDVVGRALEAECRHLHARFLALSPALLESSDICRRTIAPLLAQPPRRRQPALKMSLTAPPVRRPRATHA